MKFEVQLQGNSGTKKQVVDLEPDGTGYRVLLDGKPVAADAVQVAPNTISILLEGQSFEIHVSPGPSGTLKLQCGSQEFAAEVIDSRAWQGRKHGTVEMEGRQAVTALMSGKVVKVLVRVGSEVAAEQGVLVVEAMKMQNEIRSPKTGRIERLLVEEGQTVNSGDILAWVE